MIPDFPEGKILIQFDGICMFCSKTVRLILKADRQRKFLFQALQDAEPDQFHETIVVYDGNIKYLYFDAVLKIAWELGGIYRVCQILRIVPRNWLNAFYRLIARKRYGWFGRRKSCYLPNEEEKARFIQNSNSSFSN